MDLDEFLKYQVSLNDIKNYFSYCNKYDIKLSKKEIKILKELYEKLTKKYSKEELKEIKENIKQITIKSTCEEPETIIIINKKEIKDLTQKETYNNITILMENNFNEIYDEEIKQLLYKYLSNQVNRETLKKIENTAEEPLKSELKEIMKNNYNIIISKINKELTNNLNITKLEELIKEFKTTKDQSTFCYINYELIRKTMTSWNLEIHKKTLFKGQFQKLKYEFVQKLYEILDQKTKEKLIEKDIEEKKIELEPPIKTSITNFKINKKEIITTEHIIKTNEEYAISLRKKENLYIFNIYLPDTLDFLLKNKGIIKSIYNRGCTLETKEKKIEMIPYKFIQLNETTYKDSINFKFIFNDAGKLLSSEVKKTKIKIETQKQVEELNQNVIYKEFIEKIKKGFKIENEIKNINQLSEIFLNYYIGYNASFAIYKNNGIYTTKRRNFYTESIKPMSKFASDINLLFYLSQLGKIECPDKYLYKVLDNIDEIINHLNERNFLNEYIKNNPEKIKKYIKNN